jgi:hypothetical protein
MPRETVFKNDSATLYYYPEKKIVHHEIHKYIKGEEFKGLLNAGLDVFRKRGANKWLSDDRKNGVLLEEDEEWSSGVWFPQVLKAGWKYWAIVLPEKLVGQMNMKRFAARFEPAGVTARLFTAPEDALSWLESV